MNNSLILIKRILKYTVLIALCLLVGRMGLNYTGYCYEQGRYLTDQEKIDIAVIDLLKNFPANPRGPQVPPWSPRYFLPRDATRAQSIEDFYAMHPNCCEVTDQARFDFLQSEFIASPGQKVPLMMRLTGMVSSYVLIRYKLHYLDEDGEEKLWKNDYSYTAISNCGTTRSPIAGF